MWKKGADCSRCVFAILYSTVALSCDSHVTILASHMTILAGHVTILLGHVLLLK